MLNENVTRSPVLNKAAGMLVPSLIIVWLALRIVILLLHNDFTADDGYFLNISEQILKGRMALPLYDGTLRSSEHFYMLGFTQHLPIALCLKIFGHSNWYWCTKIPTLIEATAMLGFFAWWASRAGWRPIHVFIVTAILAFDPYFFDHSGYLRPDIACLLMMTMFLLLLYKSADTGEWKFAALSGFAAAGAVLTKWEAMSALPVALLTFSLCSRDWKSALRNMFAFGAAFAIICAPVYIYFFHDMDRLSILISQLRAGKTDYYNNIISLRHSFPLSTIITRLATMHFLRMCMLAASMSFETFYKSPGSWLLLTVLFHSALHLRDRQSRFWFILIFTELMLITFTSLELKGQRVLMFYPVVLFRFISLFRERPREAMNYSIAAAAAVILLLLTGFNEAREFNFGTATILSAALIFLIVTIIAMFNGTVSEQTGKICVAMLLVLSLLFAGKAVWEIFSTKGFFYRDNLNALSSQFESVLSDGRKHRVAIEPQFYPLLPKNCTPFASDMFVYYWNYRYWRSYYDFYSAVNADTVVVTDHSAASWTSDDFSRRYLKENFIGERKFNVDGMTFYIYKKRPGIP